MANLQQSATAESVPPQKVRTRKPSDDYLRRLPWAFLAPALVIYSVVVVYPMVYSAYLSLFRCDGISPTKVFVGRDNYVILLTQNDVFWIALKNNAIWLVCALLLPTSIGLGLGILLNSKFRGSHIFRSVFYFPAVLSLAVVGLIWTWIYHPDLGLLNQVLGALGLKGLQRNGYPIRKSLFTLSSLPPPGTPWVCPCYCIWLVFKPFRKSCMKRPKLRALVPYSVFST